MGRKSLAARSRQNARQVVKAFTEAREEAVNEMNSALKRKFAKIEKQFADAREENLRFYHALGCELIEIRNNPEVYTDKAPALLEKALATQRRTLRKAVQFADTYTNAQLDELLALEHEGTGFRVHWGHLTYLLGAPTVEKRLELARQAVNNLWDPPALHAYMKSHSVGQRGRGGGRPQKLPQTLHMMIRQMLQVCDQWVKKRKLWMQDGEEGNVFSRIMQAPPTNLNKDDLDNLKKISELLQEVGAEAVLMMEQVSSCITRVETVLEQHAAQLAQEAESAPATAPGRRQRSITLPENQESRRQRRPAPAGAR